MRSSFRSVNFASRPGPVTVRAGPVALENPSPRSLSLHSRARSTPSDKSNPVARPVRRARGLPETAQPPKKAPAGTRRRLPPQGGFLMKGFALLPLAGLAILSACSDLQQSPVNPNAGLSPGAASLAVADAYAGGPIHGAIFTTTPNGGIVNENVRYTDKREVYLDGGPPGQAPITAAGLPNGLYVFQITEPAGKVLLSSDPAKCRIVRVEGGVIRALVKPADLPSPYGPLANTF